MGGIVFIETYLEFILSFKDPILFRSILFPLEFLKEVIKSN